jgi:hypothetical protein
MWSLILREERKLQAFGDKIEEIFRPIRNEVSRQFRISHNGEFRPSKRSIITDGVVTSRTLRWTGHVARIWRQEIHI